MKNTCFTGCFVMSKKSNFFEITFYFLHKSRYVKLSTITKKSMAKPTISVFSFQKYLKQEQNGLNFTV